MNTTQFNRKITLLIGNATNALDLSELQIKFYVQRGDRETPNSVDIRIYNVSDKTASLIQKEFTRVVLKAGYDGNFGVIFDGTIKQVRKGHETSVNSYIDVTAADGDSAYNFAFVNTSFSAGGSVTDHINAIVDSMSGYGIVLGQIPTFEGNPLPRGRTMCGMARDYLNQICRSYGCDWSIQEGKLNIVPQNSYLPGEAIVINSATGMIGFPEQTINGLRVKILLNPNIRIGRRIQIDNETVQKFRYSLAISASGSNLINSTSGLKLDHDGFYKVLMAEHEGDTRGQQWYTMLTCLAIDASAPPIGMVTKMAVNNDPGPVKPYG